MAIKELDRYLKKISLKEKIYIHIMIIIGFFFLSWYLLFEPSEKRLQETIQKEREILLKISEYKTYLMFHDEHELILIKRGITEGQTEFDDFKKAIDNLNFQLHNLSDIIYNKEAWSQFLNNITILAKDNNVSIERLSNISQNTKKVFDKVLQLEIAFHSSFINTLLFISKLEGSKLIIDIQTIKIYRSKNGYQIKNLNKEELKTTIKLSVWGIQ